jgi:hypothetical protein
MNHISDDVEGQLVRGKVLAIGNLWIRWIWRGKAFTQTGKSRPSVTRSRPMTSAGNAFPSRFTLAESRHTG